MDFDGMMAKLEWLRDQFERMESEIDRLTRERDALIEMSVHPGFIWTDEGTKDGWKWRIGEREGVKSTREEAIATVRRVVRRAAGLAGEG